MRVISLTGHSTTPALRWQNVPYAVPRQLACISGTTSARRPIAEPPCGSCRRSRGIRSILRPASFHGPPHGPPQPVREYGSRLPPAKFLLRQHEPGSVCDDAPSPSASPRHAFARARRAYFCGRQLFAGSSSEYSLDDTPRTFFCGAPPPSRTPQDGVSRSIGALVFDSVCVGRTAWSLG